MAYLEGLRYKLVPKMSKRIKLKLSQKSKRLIQFSYINLNNIFYELIILCLYNLINLSLSLQYAIVKIIFLWLANIYFCLKLAKLIGEIKRGIFESISSIASWLSDGNIRAFCLNKNPTKMAKIRRILNLNRIFGISLFIGIFFIFILFLWRQQIVHQKYPYFGSTSSAFEGKITNGTRALIVDVKCLEKLAANQNCNFPIIVAIPLGHKFDEGYFMRSQFYLEDLAERNFWLFLNATNSTQKIATKKFKTQKATLRLEGNKLAELDVPIGMKRFAQHWRNGQFIDCQPPILKRPKNVERLIPLKYLDRVAEFAELLDKFNVTAFIFGGTLLGWRRECSLIPHTNDIDFAIFYEQHSDSLLRAILTSPTFIIHWVLGRLRDSFELSVNVDGFKIDLFYIYRNNNSTIIGGMRPEKRQRLIWRYPKMDGQICAGELHGRLVHVLCEYQKMIEAEYGKEEWKRDIDTNSFVWDKSQKNKESMEMYTAEEWPNVFLRVENKTERFDVAVVDKWMKNIKKSG